MKSMRKGVFMCIAPVGAKILRFNQTLTAVDASSASVAKMAKWAKERGYNDNTHIIYQVAGNAIYEYSIDKN